MELVGWACLMSQHPFVSGKVLVFFSPHKLFFFCRLVLVTTEVQRPMEDNPVQFIAEGGTELLGIVPHPVNTDVDLTNNRCGMAGKVEGDNISKVIMLQVLAVDLQQVLIRTKDETQGFQLYPFLLKSVRKNSLRMSLSFRVAASRK